MAIYNRDTFLGHLSERLGRAPRTTGVERPVWSVQPQQEVLSGLTQDELVTVLEKQCGVIHTDFQRATSDTLPDVLQSVIEKYHGKQLVVAKDTRSTLYGLDGFYQSLRNNGVSVHEWDASLGKQNQQIAEKADIGITISDMVLAESGTIALFNSKDQSRSISLLPRSYVAIIPKSSLVPRYTQLAQDIHRNLEQGERVGSCVSLVTGPSNSADIEMKLIVGVHGPIEATYIVIEDK